MLAIESSQKYGKHSAPVQKLMPWIGFVQPDMVLNKDGSLLACFDVGGVDIDSSTDEKVNRASMSIDHACSVLGGRNTLWWTVSHMRTYDYLNLTVIAFGDSAEECEAVTEKVVSEINNRGFLAIRERQNLLSSWAATLPGQWATQKRLQLVKTANLSDLAPIRTLTAGDIGNNYLSKHLGSYQPELTVFPTWRGIPYHMNLHQGQTGHGIVIGPTGAGKTVFVNFLIAQFRKYRPLTIIFDRNRSCRILTLAMGGSYLDVAKGDVKCNPIALVGDEANWPWLVSWIEMLLATNNYKTSADDKRELVNGFSVLKTFSPEMRVLGTLATSVSPSLRNELQPWCRGGELGHFFDNSIDAFNVGDLCAFEMGDMMRDTPKAARLFMEYAFYRIKEKLNGSRPGLIYIEEASFMLSDDTFCRRIDDWLRTLRKLVTSVIMATQSLPEIANSPIAATLVDNVPNWIFLPNDKALANEQMYREKFLLDPVHIDMISRATPELHYILRNKEVVRLLTARFDSETLAYLRSESKAQEVFNRHMASGHENWLQAYVDEITR